MYGHLFSYTFIYILNVFGIGLWIVLVSTITFEQMLTTIGSDFLEVVAYLRETIPMLIDTGMNHFR